MSHIKNNMDMAYTLAPEAETSQKCQRHNKQRSKQKTIRRSNNKLGQDDSCAGGRWMANKNK